MIVYEEREVLREATQNNLSAFGRRISVMLENPQTIADILNKNSKRLFRKLFLELKSAEQQGAVYMQSIERAVSNRTVNTWACTPVFSIIGGAFGAYSADKYTDWVSK